MREETPPRRGNLVRIVRLVRLVRTFLRSFEDSRVSPSDCTTPLTRRGSPRRVPTPGRSYNRMRQRPDKQWSLPAPQVSPCGPSALSPTIFLPTPCFLQKPKRSGQTGRIPE